MLSIPAPLAELGVGGELRAALLKLSAALPTSRREDEIQARIAAKSEAENARLAAATGVAATGVQSFSERLAQEQTIQGKAPSASELTAVSKLYGVDETTAAGLIDFLGRNPDAAKSIGQYLSLSQSK